MILLTFWYCFVTPKVKLNYNTIKLNRVNSKALKLKDIWELGNLRNAATRLPAKKKKDFDHDGTKLRKLLC